MFNHFAEESMGSDGPMHIERHHMSSAQYVVSVSLTVLAPPTPSCAKLPRDEARCLRYRTGVSCAAHPDPWSEQL